MKKKQTYNLWRNQVGQQNSLIKETLLEQKLTKRLTWLKSTSSDTYLSKTTRALAINIQLPALRNSYVTSRKNANLIE